MTALLLGLALLPGAAAARKPDCANPITRADMNQCSCQDRQEADRVLNDTNARAVAIPREMDSFGGRNVEETLRQARRARIGLRDLACDQEGLQAEGGSMQPLLINGCMTRLTRARADDLAPFIGT